MTPRSLSRAGRWSLGADVTSASAAVLRGSGARGPARGRRASPRRVDDPRRRRAKTIHWAGAFDPDHWAGYDLRAHQRAPDRGDRVQRMAPDP